jgi:hypothetical protein
MIKISKHALARCEQRAGFSVSEAQEKLKANNTVQLNDPARHPQFNGFRLFYNETADAFFVGVYVFSINAAEFRPTDVKTVLPLDWYERDQGAVSDKIKARAVVKAMAGRPVLIRACPDRLGLNFGGHRRFVVCGPSGKRSEIRLKGSVCPGFFRLVSVEDVCKHPGVLTRLREACATLGFKLENRQWVRFATGSISEPLLRLKARSAEACACCGAQPLATDLPLPEKVKRA